jgi:hypothetical protein
MTIYPDKPRTSEGRRKSRDFAIAVSLGDFVSVGRINRLGEYEIVTFSPDDVWHALREDI